jgi:hypothetical protein
MEWCNHGRGVCIALIGLDRVNVVVDFIPPLR